MTADTVPAPADTARSFSPLLLVPCGFAIGVAAGFTGMGGGFLLIPVLLTLGLAVRRAVATSFVAILITTVSSLAVHATAGNVSLLVGGLLGAGGMIGGQIGSRLVKKVSTRTFRRIFAVVLVSISIALVVNGVREVNADPATVAATTMDAAAVQAAINQRVCELPWLVWLLVPMGVAVGILGSFSGMGGGFILVPILLGLGLPHRGCVGSSALAVLVISVSSLQVHARERAMHWRTGLLLGGGGFLGAALGGQLVSEVSGPVFKLIFAVVLLGVAVRIGGNVGPKKPKAPTPNPDPEPESDPDPR